MLYALCDLRPTCAVAGLSNALFPVLVAYFAVSQMLSMDSCLQAMMTTIAATLACKLTLEGVRSFPTFTKQRSIYSIGEQSSASLGEYAMPSRHAVLLVHECAKKACW